ncbi:serine/threonine-protein kinase [Sorangium cellulosum]|uniref:Protein kinase domain-containing protein n=1 Tax=Sorangium cellulosum So0157-2 TaxID=1254432 RepID=S4Y4U0_SORCE|nr:serine/threonine-protein kinase [Sorangium cellulosum]AGP39839.1 hypothetical protein SCE1572_38315 [Sorangium cellulosum So0157-2]
MNRDLRAGEILGERFSIERLAGSGGMGDVYCAQDLRTGEKVAVKVLRRRTDAARFAREASLLASIEHPRVVRHVTHGALPSGEPYLVMEWLEGEDLAARLERGRLDVASAVALATAVSEALGALHDRRIVHRDLKPSNVFLVERRLDRIKLLDLGVARHEDAASLTGTGLLVGTAMYMAPEQARGAADVDARADVFALGCLLFECLAGEPAFSGAHAMAILTKILFDETPRLADRCGGAPAALDDLVARLLSRDPAARPADGRAAGTALRALGALPGAALEPSAPSQRPTALTASERRTVAVLFISAPQGAAPPASDDLWVAAEAATYGGAFARLCDGSAAVLLSGTSVATDLAAQAARCALSISRRAGDRRIALTMGRGEVSGRRSIAPAIDRAARVLDSSSASGEIATGVVTLDEAMVGLLDARFDVRDASGVFVLRAERDVAEIRTLLGKPTPCVGRERELRSLEGLFQDCVDQRGAQVALVTAPPGVGKSRLGSELVRALRARGEDVDIWIARGEPLRAGSAFGVLAQLVQAAIDLRGGEPLDARRGALVAALDAAVDAPSRLRIAEFLGELIGAQFPDDQSLPLRAARLDPPLMSEHVRDAFVDFLAARCAERPVLLLIEDLHWADAPSVRALDHALLRLEERPLFVLALGRPEVHETFEDLWKGRPLQEIRLRELPRKAAERLVQGALGARATPGTVERIVRLSEGNAFFLEELIRSVAERGEADLPETVVAMIHARLGALDDEARRILRAASVFGETFWAGGVAALLGERGGHASSVRARIDALAERELVQKRKSSRFDGEAEYAFRHALLREGASAMLTEKDRSLGHRLAAEWLEVHGEEDATVMAEHFEKGGDAARAGDAWLRAGERMAWGGDTRKTLALLERGLACPVTPSVRHRLLGMLCETTMWRMENVLSAAPAADELLAGATPGSAPWAQALLVRVTCAGLAGDAQLFEQAVADLMTAAFQREAADPAVLTFAAAVFLLDLFGQVPQANALFGRFEALARWSEDHAPSTGGLYAMMAAARAALGFEDPWGGLQHARAGIAKMTAIGHRRNLLASQTNVGMNSWFLGVYGDAKRSSLAAASEDEYGLASSLRPFTLAWACADMGEHGEARAWATRLAEGGRARRAPLDESRGRWALAEALRRAGELEAADAEARVALSLSVPLDRPGILATIAALRLAEGRVAEALASSEEAAAQLDAIGTAAFFRNAFVRLVRAECLEAAGDREGAKAVLRKARGWLLAVAEKIGDPDYRRSFLDDVPENRRTLELASRAG